MTDYLRSFRGAAILIGQDEADAIRTALDTIYAQIAFEELWDAVAQNFLDLERDLLSNALDNMLFGGRDWNHYQDIRTLFARRLANLLSSCRAYLDLSGREITKMPNAAEVQEAFSSLRSQAYDAHFSYRLMEAVRNYTQHYGSPIKSTHLDSRRISNAAGDQIRFVTAASIDPEALRQDPRFKASVRAELANMGKLEVNKYAREYIEQLAFIHMSTRQLGLEMSRAARDVVTSAIAKVEGSGLDADFGAYLISSMEDGPDRRRALMIEPFDRLNLLQQRNGSLHSLSSRYVSGELLGAHLK